MLSILTGVLRLIAFNTHLLDFGKHVPKLKVFRGRTGVDAFDMLGAAAPGGQNAEQKAYAEAGTD